MSGKFALIIGNTEYTDPGLAQLTAPGKDTEDFARVLKDPNLCGFDNVRVLLNQLSPSVVEAIDEFFDQKKPDDTLVLYFSGHGVRDEIGSLYLAFTNTIRTRLRSTAIKADYIKEAMDQSRSKRQVLILDCCNSGAFPQGTKAEVGGVMGLTQAFQGYGRFVLTASDATQFAWEGNQVIGETDNSLFTHFLVKGLEGEADSDGDGKITVDELYDYAFEEVSKVTPKQTPTKSASKVEGDIVLRQITRIEDIKPISLPEELIEATEDSRTFVREGAVQQLEKLLKGKNLGLARSAREVLERMEKEDDSRRVSQAAIQALASIRQAEQLTIQKAEEEKKAKKEAKRLAALKAKEARLAREKAEAYRKAKEEAERLLAEQKAEKERKAREEAELIALLKTEEERLAAKKAEDERRAKEETDRLLTQQRAKEEVERRAADLAAHQAAQQAAHERSARNRAQLENRLNQVRAYGKARWKTLVDHLRSIPNKRPQLYLWLGLGAVFLSGMVFLIYQQSSNPTLFFSRKVGWETDIYSYHNDAITKVTDSSKRKRSWSPVTGFGGELYFTSDRTGEIEIYRIKKDGQAEQMTNTPGSANSWSPAIDISGELVFTSNRAGKAEIYRITKAGQVERMTNTPGSYQSWSPTISLIGEFFFVSDRTGAAEIYRINADGQVEQMTNTPDPYESWSPAVGVGGELFFASNRTGKTEIYRIRNDGQVQQMTNTPGSYQSWAPVIQGRNLYFTSNRDGSNSVYFLDNAEVVQISPAWSWTTTLSAKYPSPNP